MYMLMFQNISPSKNYVFHELQSLQMQLRDLYEAELFELMFH